MRTPLTPSVLSLTLFEFIMKTYFAGNKGAKGGARRQKPIADKKFNQMPDPVRLPVVC